jgi:hypothetical protein
MAERWDAGLEMYREPTLLDLLAEVLAESNGTPWDFTFGGADDLDPYYRDASAVVGFLRAKEAAE